MQIVLGGSNYDELARWRDIVIAGVRRTPASRALDSDLRETQPQVLVRVDTDRAASLGVSARSIGSTLQALMSEQQVTTYVVDGEEYDVVLRPSRSSARRTRISRTSSCARSAATT